MKNLIKISREEADMMRQKAPSAHIAIVNRQHRSKEKTYYVEENRTTVALLQAARGLLAPAPLKNNFRQNRPCRGKNWR